MKISTRRWFVSLCSLCCAFCLVFALTSSALAEEEQQNSSLSGDDVVYAPPEDVHTSPIIDDIVFEPPIPPESIDNSALLLGWLMDNGYTFESAAAIGGNLNSESPGINPLRLEGGVGNGREYVADNFRAINSNGYKTYVGGFGICQWTSYSRVLNLQRFADDHNLPVSSIEAQFRFLIAELAKYDMTPDYLNSLSFEEATFAIYRYYLTPGSSLWTSHYNNGRYRYYNSYSPTSYSGGRTPLSQNSTPSAYRAFNVRYEHAKNFLDIKPDRGQYVVYNDTFYWLDPNAELIVEPTFTVEMFIIPEEEVRDDIGFDEDAFEQDAFYEVLDSIDVPVDVPESILSSSSNALSGINSSTATPTPTPTPMPTPIPKVVEPVTETVELPLLNLR